jgi:hypothetical protein
MATFGSLAAKLEKLAPLAGGGDATVQKVAAAVLKDLVYATPVDTSKALSNWQVSVGVPPSADIPAYSVGKKGSTRNVSASQAIAAGLSAIASRKAGQSLFISNLTPYIKKLDNGNGQPGQPHAVHFGARARLVARKVQGR